MRTEEGLGGLDGLWEGPTRSHPRGLWGGSHHFPGVETKGQESRAPWAASWGCAGNTVWTLLGAARAFAPTLHCSVSRRNGPPHPRERLKREGTDANGMKGP